MLIGEVIGSVVATRKDPGIGERKLLVVQIRDHQNKPKDQYVVAIDAVGAGPGDIVLYASGSSARQTEWTKDKPCDAVIMAIIDSWDVDGELVWDRQAPAVKA